MKGEINSVYVTNLLLEGDLCISDVEYICESDMKNKILHMFRIGFSILSIAMALNMPSEAVANVVRNSNPVSISQIQKANPPNIAKHIKQFKGVNWDKLLNGLFYKESTFGKRLYGDKEHGVYHAFGPFQIRQEALDDYNRWTGENLTLRDVLDKETSERVVKVYLSYYGSRIGRTPTYKDLSRIWNGGPTGHKKADTVAYWVAVKPYVESYMKV